ncbi:MAG: sugar transferase [Bacillota bacterium]|nr:sugar transferase [Bacillota bacterium]
MQNFEIIQDANITSYKCEIKKSFLYYALKRVIDVTGSLVGIIIFLPILIFTSIAIKIDSKGPVIFSEERVGLNGKVFKMYKFRTMISNAEELLPELKNKNEISEPMFKISYYPRITRVGRIIRKMSIDELPQFFNVLLGDMSLVGPRPNLPSQAEKFSEIHKIKLLAKPGLTCYWQVMGRSDIDFEEWMMLDIKYLEDRNLWLDIKLIFITSFLLFGNRNDS